MDRVNSYAQQTLRAVMQPLQHTHRQTQTGTQTDAQADTDRHAQTQADRQTDADRHNSHTML